MDLPLYKLESLEIVVKIDQSDNPNGVTVVYDSSAEANEVQLFLEKVFSAVSISYAAVHKVTVLNGKPASLVDWSEWPNCQKLLFFGVNPKQLGIHYELQALVPKTVNNRKLLVAPDLISIQGKPELKKGLWVALQQIFDING